MAKNAYYVDIKSDWHNKWANINGFTDIYEAIDYAVNESKTNKERKKWEDIKLSRLTPSLSN